MGLHFLNNVRLQVVMDMMSQQRGNQQPITHTTCVHLHITPLLLVKRLVVDLSPPHRQPIVTGASVLAIKYKDGVMMMSDTLGEHLYHHSSSDVYPNITYFRPTAMINKNPECT
jgi:hypothetical protein